MTNANSGQGAAPSAFSVDTQGQLAADQYRLTSGQNISDVFRYAVGMENMFETSPVNTGNFPPHNIEKIDDERYILTLAIAGFTKDEVDITLHKGFLRIEGKKAEIDHADLNATLVLAGVTPKPIEKSIFLYKGIAFRDFAREFRLGEDVEISSATLADGLLKIGLTRIIPPEDRPKKIAIK
jgi:molecular chaperone IbpA